MACAEDLLRQPERDEIALAEAPYRAAAVCGAAARLKKTIADDVIELPVRQRGDFDGVSYLEHGEVIGQMSLLMDSALEQFYGYYNQWWLL